MHGGVAGLIFGTNFPFLSKWGIRILLAKIYKTTCKFAEVMQKMVDFFRTRVTVQSGTPFQFTLGLHYGLGPVCLPRVSYGFRSQLSENNQRSRKLSVPNVAKYT